ncbi:MAG TPA: AMIN domain-containing protein, partial [Candidatus Acidoferrales bacterium]|nr:AMIN domain-containing protein [Candidatus Acidoferrales bacterium]
MMRRNGSEAVRWGLIVASVALLAGCRPKVVTTAEEPVTTVSSPVDPDGHQAPMAETGDTTAPPAPDAVAVASLGTALEIREIKLVEDNGQQGLFIKLSGRPTAVNNLILSQPTRLVIDISGANVAVNASAQRFTVKNPLVNEIRTANSAGQIRVTVQLRGSTPAYNVSDLNDTVVAFLGEPTGGTESIREQIVYSRRAGAMEASADLEPTNGKRSKHSEDAYGANGDSGDRTTMHPAWVGQHVSLDFKDADVHNVLRLLAEVSKLNIIATDDVHGKVTLHLFDVPWDQALDIILQSLSLESIQEGNVLRISTVKRIREEREEMKRAEEAAKVLEPLRVDYIKVNYTKARALGDIISGAARSRSTQLQNSQRSTAAEEGVLSARGSVFVDELSNTIIVRDIQHGIDNARDLVRRLDVQTPQVLIESNIVEATADFARELGVQWGYRYLAGPATGNPTGANFPGTIGVGGSGLGTGANGVPFIADFPAASAVAGGGSAFDLALGSLDGSHTLDVRISALERIGKARIVSKPRVVTLNNVAATIKSLTVLRVRLPVANSIISTGAGGTAAPSTAATEKIETGIILVVTPQ